MDSYLEKTQPSLQERTYFLRSADNSRRRDSPEHQDTLKRQLLLTFSKELRIKLENLHSFILSSLALQRIELLACLSYCQ
jgi:hypothetical protein